MYLESIRTLLGRLGQTGDNVRGTSVGPHDGVVERLSGRAVPDNGGLSLVGDTDA